MENNDPKPRVKLPEAEAVKLAAMIRGRVSKMPIVLSVFAFISKKGLPALEVQVDYTNPQGVVETANYNYKASDDPFAVSRHVLKRIKSQFDL